MLGQAGGVDTCWYDFAMKNVVKRPIIVNNRKEIGIQGRPDFRFTVKTIFFGVLVRVWFFFENMVGFERDDASE